MARVGMRINLSNIVDRRTWSYAPTPSTLRNRCLGDLSLWQRAKIAPHSRCLRALRVDIEKRRIRTQTSSCIAAPKSSRPIVLVSQIGNCFQEELDRVAVVEQNLQMFVSTSTWTWRGSSRDRLQTLQEHLAVDGHWDIGLKILHFLGKSSRFNLWPSALHLGECLLSAWRQHCACQALARSRYFSHSDLAQCYLGSAIHRVQWRPAVTGTID